jgi:hypothetical protein
VGQENRISASAFPNRLAHLPNRIASSFAAVADIRINPFLEFDFNYTSNK